jgi:3-deoxy-manno-octulosonate cytidylyltransferase (CMP-KDO synthetase)
MAGTLKIAGVIPARLDSKRLPGKVLRRIAGKAMAHWVYERARGCPLLDSLTVATESPEVYEYCQDQAIPVIMTGRHPSGSDRLHEVMERTDADVYANIQGDEPTLTPDHLNLLLQPILKGDAEVSTLKVGIDETAARDPNNVKVVTDVNGHALYFSRYAIPFDRDGNGTSRYYKHSASTLTPGLPWHSFTGCRKLRSSWRRNSSSCVIWRAGSRSWSRRRPATRSASTRRRTCSESSSYSGNSRRTRIRCISYIVF